MNGTTDKLSDDDKAMLDLERGWYMHSGVKETRVREQFGCSLTTYYRRLNRLLERPEALAYDAQLVRRLLRMRESRRAVRTARRLA